MTKANAVRRRVGLNIQNQPAIRVAAREEFLHVPENSRLNSLNVPAGKTAIFLDRDGVIIEDVHFLKSPAQIHILPGVAKALQLLSDRFYIIVATNQSGVARGLITEGDLLEIHSQLVRLLAAEDAVLDALYYCPHLAEATVPVYQAECNCRKPKPGMLLRAKHDWGIDLKNSFIIGDTPRDIEAGYAAGIKGILLGAKETALPGLYGVAPDLFQAAHLILSHSEV